jgi:hypothetical protein
MSEEGCRIRILVETEAQRAEALAAIEALCPAARWLSGQEIASWGGPTLTPRHFLTIDREQRVGWLGVGSAYASHLPPRPWAEVTAAELLAALRPQPEPESWPGPHVEEIPGGTTVIYRDGRLRVGCSTLTADSVRNLIVAYDKHHGKGRIQDLSG